MNHNTYLTFFPNSDLDLYGENPIFDQYRVLFVLKPDNYQFFPVSLHLTIEVFKIALPIIFALRMSLMPPVNFSTFSDSNLLSQVSQLPTLTTNLSLSPTTNPLLEVGPSQNFTQFVVSTKQTKQTNKHSETQFQLFLGSGTSIQFSDNFHVESFTGLLSESNEILTNLLTNNGSTTPQMLENLTRSSVIVKNSFLNQVRTRLVTAGFPIPARTIQCLPFTFNLSTNSSGLCIVDEMGNFQEEISYDLVHQFLGRGMQANLIRSHVNHLNKLQCNIQELEMGITIAEITRTVTELRNVIDTIQNRILKAPKNDFSKGNLQLYSRPLPFLNLNLAGEYNFKTKESFVGLGRATFRPLVNFRLWEARFGAAMGLDCSVGYNFDTNQYLGVKTKVFIGFGVMV